MVDENVTLIEPKAQIIQPRAPGTPLLMDDVFPALDIAGREEEINSWFENDIKRCATFVRHHQDAWERWRAIYDLETVADLYSDIGGRADFPSGLLCEKTIGGIDRLMRAVYVPDPLFAVHEAMSGEEDIETILRYEQWMNFYCRQVLKLERVFGKRAFLDFLLFGSMIAEPDTLFKIVPQRTIKTYRTREELEEDQDVITDISALDEKFASLDDDIPVRMVVERDNVEEMGLNIFLVDLTDHLVPPNVFRDEEIRFRARRLYYTESDLRVLASKGVAWYSEKDVDEVVGQREQDVEWIKMGKHPVRYSKMRTDSGTAPGFEWYDSGSEYGDKKALPYEDVYIVFRIFARYAYPTRKDPRGIIPKWTVWDWEPCSQTILRARTYPHFDERLPWIHFRLGVSRKSYYGFGFGALLEKEDSRQSSIMNLFLDSEAMACYAPYLARSPESGGSPTPFRFGMGPGQVGFVHDVLRDFKQIDLRGPSQNLLGSMYPISTKLAENRTSVTSYTMGQTEGTDPRSPARKTELLLGQAQLGMESIIRDWNIGWEELAHHIWRAVYESTIIRGEDERSGIVAAGDLEGRIGVVSLDDLEKEVIWISQASAGVVNPQARKADFLNKFSFFIPLIQRLWEVNQQVGVTYFLRWMKQAASELELRGKQYLIPTEAEMQQMPPEAMQGVMQEMQEWTKAGGQEGVTPQPATPEGIMPPGGEAETAMPRM